MSTDTKFSLVVERDELIDVLCKQHSEKHLRSIFSDIIDQKNSDEFIMEILYLAIMKFELAVAEPVEGFTMEQLQDISRKMGEVREQLFEQLSCLS